MKNRNRANALFVLLCAGALAGCSGTEEVTSDPQGGSTRVMYASGSFSNENAPQTRMSYTDDLTTDFMSLAWSAGDRFSAFVGTTASPYTFEIESPQHGSSYTNDELFKCTDFPAALDNGTMIDAIYPAVPQTTDPNYFTVDLSQQTQVGNGSTAHLHNYDYMVAHARYSSATPDNLNLNFKDVGDGNAGRLASIYRIRVVLPAEVTQVLKIRIRTMDNNMAPLLPSKMVVNIKNGITATVPREFEDITLNVTSGTTELIDGKNTFTGYVMLFPGVVKTRTLYIFTEKGMYHNEYTYPQEVIYTRGLFKLIDATVSDSDLDTYDNYRYDEFGEGTAESPYLLFTRSQLSSLSNHQNNWGDVTTKSGSSENVHFKMMKDIAFPEGLRSLPIGNAAHPFTGIFDGNGKTISNLNITNETPHCGFFGKIAGGTVKDLTVKGTLTATAGETDDPKTFYVGGLVGLMESGTLSGTLCSEIAVTVTNKSLIWAGGLIGFKAPEVVIASGASLSASGDVSATINEGSIGTLGIGKLIGNGTVAENEGGTGTLTITAPKDTPIIENGVLQFGSMEGGSDFENGGKYE